MGKTERLAFIYGRMGCHIDDIKWIDKPGICCCSDAECSLKYYYNDIARCKDNLTGHCCKHVVNGNDGEKEQFENVTNQLGISSTIPRRVTDNSLVVESYEAISHDVLKKPSIAVSGEGDKIRYMCGGRDITEGIVDFVGYEYRWNKDYESKRLVKDKSGYKVLGIVSSYFNYSNPEIFVLYRLVHQRYYERLSEGINVSPVVKVKEIYNGYYDQKRITEVPIIDFAFKHGSLFYLQSKSKNFSAGVIYYFYQALHLDELCEFYEILADKMPNAYKVDKLIWDDSYNTFFSGELKKRVKIFENVYASKIIMEYIHLLSIPGFKEQCCYSRMKKPDYCPDFANALPIKTGQVLRIQQIKKLELIIQKKYVEQKKYG